MNKQKNEIDELNQVAQKFNQHAIPPIQSQSIQVSWTSPIPPPSEMEKYQQLGLQSQLLNMIETQSAHRRELEKKDLDAKIATWEANKIHIEKRDSEATRGQLLAFFISIFAISIGSLLVYLGHDITGTIFSLGGLTPLAAKFIEGRTSKNE